MAARSAVIAAQLPTQGSGAEPPPEDGTLAEALQPSSPTLELERHGAAQPQPTRRVADPAVFRAAATRACILISNESRGLGNRRRAD